MHTLWGVRCCINITYPPLRAPVPSACAPPPPKGPSWEANVLALEGLRKTYFVHTKEPCKDVDLQGFDIPCP